MNTIVIDLMNGALDQVKSILGEANIIDFGPYNEMKDITMVLYQGPMSESTIEYKLWDKNVDYLGVADCPEKSYYFDYPSSK